MTSSTSVPPEAAPLTDASALAKKSQRMLVWTSCSLVSLAGLCGLAGFFVGKNVGIRAHESAAERPGAVLMEWEGRKYSRADLPAPVQEKLKAADAKREDARFQADYARVREIDNALRGFVVGDLAQKKAAADKTTVEVATRALTDPEKVTADDARDLFEASDPSAPARDFERVRTELLAYIEEVARREAADRLLAGLEKESRLRLHLQLPTQNAHRFELEGFPSVGPKDATVTLVNFTDFLCDECAPYNLELAQLVAKQGVSARFVFVPFPYTRPDKAMSLARGAMCASAMGSYLDYHMQVVGLGEHARKANGIDIAHAAKLDMPAFMECYRKGTGVAALLASAQAEARSAGVLRVPVSFLQGKAFEGRAGLETLTAELEKKPAQ